MEVILLQDVSKQGKKGSVIKVADGYAKNYLFPNNLAKPMNSQSKKELEDVKNAENFHKEEDRQQAINISNKIGGKSITLNLKHGENGKTYGAVTNKAVSEKLAQDFGVNIDKKKIIFEDIENGNIKSPGIYGIKIKLFSDVDAIMKLIVE